MAVKLPYCLHAELLQADAKSKRGRIVFMACDCCHEILGCHQKGNFAKWL